MHLHTSQNADTEEVRPDGESKDGKESLENEGFRRRRTVIDTGQSSSVMKYMILEDLVYQFKKPCVMDVKMGKRQRKIGASLEKEQRQLEKSFKTTSHAVGFRLCGCQVFHLSKYKSINKSSIYLILYLISISYSTPPPPCSFLYSIFLN